MGATILLILALQAAAPAAAPAGVVLQVGGAVSQPLALSFRDLIAMPRTTVQAQEHGKTVTYEGVTLTAILQKTGAPLGGQMRGKALATYVLITARDAYRVVIAKSAAVSLPGKAPSR